MPTWRSSLPSGLLGSQSSSAPLQTSALEPVLSLQASAPSLQKRTPSPHRSVSSPSHRVPTPGSSLPSGLDGSQSLSRPSQVSTSVPVLSVQTTPPAPSHVLMPSLHRSPSAPSQAAPIEKSSSTS